jgi:hypothetical protein
MGRAPDVGGARAACDALLSGRIVRRTRGHPAQSNDPIRSRWALEDGPIGDPIGAAANLLHNAFVWLQTLVPGGFALLIIPLGVLASISLWFAFHR